MIASYPSDRFLARRAGVSGLIYVLLVIVLCLAALFLAMDVVERYRAHYASLEILAQLQERAQHSSFAPSGTQSWPTGSPFLEGETVTLASAALLQRLTSAITRVGGSVVSSEIEQVQSKDTYLKATATCELEQSALQQLLYDVESGMPFLFVEQLVVQPATAPNLDGRIRVILSVSGMWSGAK